jgi:hypothetical protein
VILLVGLFLEPEQQMDGDKMEVEEIFSVLQQKEIVKSEINSKPKEGETWYVISQKWFEIWKKYVNYDDKDEEGGNPGEIENEPLLADPSQNKASRLSRNVQEGSNFVLVNEKIGKMLHSTYF